MLRYTCLPGPQMTRIVSMLYEVDYGFNFNQSEYVLIRARVMTHHAKKTNTKDMF